jgi:hypothetical protein
MVVEVSPMLKIVAKELHLSEADLILQGVRALLERQLLQINAQLLQISGRYGVHSVEEMETRYQVGTLDEADSWRDMQRLDHLEFERDRLLELLGTVA